ncbi:CRISPR-associated RAMP protein, Cmr1 family [Chloroherpeton thalassium ATCC 35110]|uniref:CRISPR-associated RAMP protein, Cmr1 family n=1 Tax=Chloroherpeton thalassium (strain ATCC 35110 / GB-78) TaxID=517418 RepID=B3QXD2_CHLT3|nr:type III-B CRISPR module RAMP protein Cmr1 [Chloroherpeton thalassium]ACF13406.1 CRISPR-associated RAMP protein, Cmr1 family [Chloroherpeton thalassium ATCC 35110]
MNSITFKCEIITPMFLAGADGATPEIRPQSIKGALRFWWRALNGHLPIEELRKKEAEIFGGGGDKAIRSSVIIKTSHPVHDGKFYPDMLPHKENPGHRNPQKAFNPQTPQSFVVKFSLSSIKHNFDLEKLKSLFILTCLLGGLGKRSRRGFGSFRITKIKKNDQIDFESFEMPTTLEDILPLIHKFNTDYEINKSNNNIQLVKPSSPDRKYEIEYPYIEEIKIGSKPYSSYSDLVTQIGKSSHDNQDKSNGYATPRFASPTYVSALKRDDQYFPIITSLHYAPPQSENDFPKL